MRDGCSLCQRLRNPLLSSQKPSKLVCARRVYSEPEVSWVPMFGDSMSLMLFSVFVRLGSNFSLPTCYTAYTADGVVRVGQSVTNDARRRHM